MSAVSIPDDREQPVKKKIFTPKNIVLAIIGLWIIASVPVWFFQTNPPVQSEPAWDSPQTRALAKRACFDCHSNETTWPLYSRVAPVSYIVTNHVVEGREKFNFSEWGATPKSGQGSLFATSAFAQEKEKEKEGEENEGGEGGEGGEVADEMIEEIEKGEMPLKDYLSMHAEARLSDAEKQQLIDGLRTTFR
jgi:hypothetical protein